MDELQSTNQLHTIIHMLLFEFPDSRVQKSKLSPLSVLHTFWLTVYNFMWELIKLPYKTEGNSLIKLPSQWSPGYSRPTCHKLQWGTVGYKELRSDLQYAGQVAHQLWNVKGKATALSTFTAKVFQMLHVLTPPTSPFPCVTT